MHRIIPSSLLLSVAVLACAAPALARAQTAAPIQAPQVTPEFKAWLSEFRAEAISRGIRTETADKALKGVAPVKRVIELDRRQPEFTQTFWTYLDRGVSDERVSKGREMLAKHAKLLSRIHKRFGVPPRFLVAFWGMETHYGKYTGKMPIVASLATLAYDRRRSRFFREQLIAALQIMDKGHIPVSAEGSWAGAMGQAQFIPTTYRDYAMDGDGDSRIDMWNSLPDVFASASNYLSRAGWQSTRSWGREVRLPKNQDLSLTGLSVKKKIAEWQKLGIRRMDGRDLPKVDVMASLILPSGLKGPAFLVYKNFRTILIWNRSIFYAVAVGHLADRLVGKGNFLTARPAKDVPLHRDQVLEIQRLLATRGYDPGPADGIAGSRTRKAVKAFQRARRIPADGHLDVQLLTALQSNQPKSTQSQ